MWPPGGTPRVQGGPPSRPPPAGQASAVARGGSSRRHPKNTFATHTGRHASHLQHTVACQGTVQAGYRRSGGHVRVRHDGLRLLPPGARAHAGGVRRGAALAARQRLPGQLRAQHHGHRRQDHPPRRRDPPPHRRGHRVLHRRHARRRARAGRADARQRAPRHAVRGRNARHHRPPAAT